MNQPLERGNCGSMVRLLQQRLCEVYIPIKVDGYFGPATELAVKMFQLNLQMDAAGQVDEKTWQSLGYQGNQAVHFVNEQKNPEL